LNVRQVRGWPRMPDQVVNARVRADLSVAARVALASWKCHCRFCPCDPFSMMVRGVLEIRL
jgi:hypothetical protein